LKPNGDQISIAALDEAAAVYVLALEGKDEFRIDLGHSRVWSRQKNG
jgi:hypothetical protein